MQARTMDAGQIKSCMTAFIRNAMTNEGTFFVDAIWSLGKLQKEFGITDDELQGWCKDEVERRKQLKIEAVQAVEKALSTRGTAPCEDCGTRCDYDWLAKHDGLCAVCLGVKNADGVVLSDRSIVTPPDEGDGRIRRVDVHGEVVDWRNPGDEGYDEWRQLFD